VPMIELTLPEGAIARDRRDALVADITETLLRWEGAGDSPVAREIAWAWVNEVPAGDFYVAGRPAADGDARYRVKITVPAGALDDERKAGLVEEVTRAVLEADGGEDAARVWVIVREVADGNWGGAGRIFRLRDIAALVREGAPVSG
jgi:phenylpyruvate tautomerase PptA (4-oxalocrotonate tautomerase family)